jgi:indolepyruvate ferredoxin oxidoreductase beta subunit
MQNFLLVGVGGQGTLLASNVLAQVGVRAGFDVKKAEVHGMAQRGGSVSSHIRWGERVYSPLIGRGEADVLVSFEKLESLRYVNMLRPGGTVIIGETRIPPLSVSSGSETYPDDEEIRRVFAQVTDDLRIVPSVRLAEQIGNVRVSNVIVLGGLSTRTQVPQETWLEVVAELVPAKFVELNRQAFLAGANERISESANQRFAHSLIR